eukprot:66218-Hanusia_phi.AAC.1
MDASFSSPQATVRYHGIIMRHDASAGPPSTVRSHSGRGPPPGDGPGVTMMLPRRRRMQRAPRSEFLRGGRMAVGWSDDGRAAFAAENSRIVDKSLNFTVSED